MTASHHPIPRTLVNQILHMAQSSPDRVIGGLIGASNGLVKSFYPVAMTENTHSLSPAGQDEALSMLHARGENLFAILHSHPLDAAIPTTEDIENINAFRVLHLIISLKTKGVLELRGYRTTDKPGYEEIVLTLDS